MYHGLCLQIKKRVCRRIKDFMTQVCFWIMGEIHETPKPMFFLRLWRFWIFDMIGVRQAWLNQSLISLCLLFLTIYSRKNFVPWKHTALGWKKLDFMRVVFISRLKVWNVISYKTLEVKAGGWDHNL